MGREIVASLIMNCTVLGFTSLNWLRGPLMTERSGSGSKFPMAIGPSFRTQDSSPAHHKLEAAQPTDQR